MANYKVVDSQKLDADLTLVADAIRKRSGSSGKLEFPQAMADTVLAIPAEGMKLPELETPAAASDLAFNKQLIGPDGNIVTGTLYELIDSSILIADRTHSVGGTKGDTTFNVSGVYPGASVDGVIVRPNARLGVRKIPTSHMGNATADQVAKGATFTSAAGFLVEGTLETGGVHMSVDGETLVITGAVTIENETLLL